MIFFLNCKFSVKARTSSFHPCTIPYIYYSDSDRYWYLMNIIEIQTETFYESSARRWFFSRFFQHWIKNELKNGNWKRTRRYSEYVCLCYKFVSSKTESLHVIQLGIVILIWVTLKHQATRQKFIPQVGNVYKSVRAKVIVTNT